MQTDIHFRCRIYYFYPIQQKKLKLLQFHKWFKLIMDFVRLLFSSGNESLAADSLKRIYSSIGLNSNSPLPDNYYQLIIYSSGSVIATSMFAEVVHGLPKLESSSAFLKVFTIVIKTVRQTVYEQAFLEILQQMEHPRLLAIGQTDSAWANQVTVAVVSYLTRLPSMGDVFRRAIQSAPLINFRTGLSDLYRLMNLCGLLFPNLCNALNTIGRYYMKSHLFFGQFYCVLKQQILLAYQYIESIVRRFITSYKECEIYELKCFIKSLPDIQLFCDKAEEFLMNKYFKGKPPSKKIYFREEDVHQIHFYLDSVKLCHFVEQQDLHL